MVAPQTPLLASAPTVRLLCCEVVPQALAYSEKPMPPEEMDGRESGAFLGGFGGCFLEMGVL